MRSSSIVSARCMDLEIATEIRHSLLELKHITCNAFSECFFVVCDAFKIFKETNKACSLCSCAKKCTEVNISDSSSIFFCLVNVVPWLYVLLSMVLYSPFIFGLYFLFCLLLFNTRSNTVHCEQSVWYYYVWELSSLYSWYKFACARWVPRVIRALSCFADSRTFCLSKMNEHKFWWFCNNPTYKEVWRGNGLIQSHLKGCFVGGRERGRKVFFSDNIRHKTWFSNNVHIKIYRGREVKIKTVD